MNADTFDQSTLSCLPEYVVETIIRLLGDQRKSENITSENNSFISCPQDVLNLRLTCSRMAELVNGSRLRLHCVLGSRWIFPERRSGLSQLLDFMKDETLWKISTLSVRLYSPVILLQIEPLLQSYQNLFNNNVILDLHVRSQSELDAMGSWLLWLPVKALKLALGMSREFNEDSPTSFVDPTLVDELKILSRGHNLTWYQFPQSINYFLSSFTNLSKLELNSNFPAENLVLAPKLRKLSVASLIIPLRQHENFCMTQIAELALNFLPIDDIRKISNLLGFWFPQLIYFTVFISGLRSRNMTASEFNLPLTCTTLKTESYLLPLFKNCTSIQYINLVVDSYTPQKFHLYNKTCLSALDLQATILTLHVSHNYSCVGIWQSILNIVQQMKRLEVLSLDASFVFGKSWIYLESQPAEKMAAIGLLFKGNETVFNQRCRELIFRIEEQCRNRELKFMILGKTGLCKRTTDSALFQEIKELENRYGWRLQQDCYTWRYLKS